MWRILTGLLLGLISLGIGVWLKYSERSWGERFTPLESSDSGDEKSSDDEESSDREGFYVHGGYDPGSRGCIDLTEHNEWFHRILGALGQATMVSVSYGGVEPTVPVEGGQQGGGGGKK